jgi:hypothetical protein
MLLNHFGERLTDGFQMNIGLANGEISLNLIVGGRRARVCKVLALMQVIMQLTKLGIASNLPNLQ